MNPKPLILWSGFIGALYILYGILEILFFFTGELAFPLRPPAEPLAGAMLLIVGSILLNRIGDLMKMKYTGLSFLAGGLVLSGILGIMYLLMAGADILNCAVLGETWSFHSGYNIPAIVLAFLLLPAWICVKKRGDFCE